jgi:branched-chain amino acid transport system substrate-binding protein
LEENMFKSKLAVVSLLAIAGLLLGACQPAAQPYSCTDEIGCIDIAPGAPIHIAWAMVVAGADSSLGIDSRRGVEIAIDDKGGTLLGHPIELTGEDTGCNAEGGQAAAQKLAADNTIVAIVGTSCSSEARVAAPILSDAGFTMISASNTAPDLTAPDTHVAGYLRTAHNDEVQGAVAAEFAYNSLGVRSAATIHDGSLYAQKLQQVFADRFVELGGTIVAQAAVQPTDTDMRPVLTTLAADAPELIYYPIFVAAGGFITAQIPEVPGLENVARMGSDGIFSPDFLTAAGSAVEGQYLSSPDFSAFTSGYADFLAKHTAKYGENPLSAFHAHGYDATNIIFAAIEKVAVQDADGTLHIPRKALRDAMFATSGFQGLTGTLTCTATGDCGDPKIAVYEVVNADPASWAPGAAADSNPKKIYP